MRISWNWLNDYIQSELSVDEVSKILTSIGLEVEAIEPIASVKGGLEGLVIGEVKACEKHANADKLKVTQVDLGSYGTHQIVCGAPNVAVGQKVVVATVGAVLYPTSGDSFEIKAAKIRGEESFGMICAEDEIGLGTSHDGIIVLPANAQVGALAKDYYQIHQDIAIEIGLTPNRTDAMSHQGVARDLHVAMEAKNIPHTYNQNGKTFGAIQKSSDTKKLEIEVLSEDCKIYQGAVLTGITQFESPEWLKFRLQVIGERSINSVVDCSNYILHDLGYPTHCFDYQKIANGAIQVKNLDANEKFESLNDQKLNLTAEDLVISDKEKSLCLAGIIGGKNSCVTYETTSLMLECAFFEATRIRKTSTRLNVKTESSSKFEKSVNPNAAQFVMQKMLSMLSEIAGVSLASEIVSIQKDVFEPYSVTLTKTRLDMYAGRKMNAEEVSAIFKNLEIEIENFENETWSLKVPLFKFDVNREEDVIEEVLRITGYDAVPYPKHLKSNIVFTDKISRHKLEEHIGASLQGDGFNEIMTNSISQSKYYENPIMLLNSMTSELDCMRTHLLPGFLEVAQYNINRDSKDIKFYEFGNVYFNSGSYNQSKVLGILISGNHQAPTWLQPKGDTSSYFHIKSTVESILNRFIDNLKFEDLEIKFFNYGAKILYKKNEIGQMGEVSNEMKKSFDIKQDLFFAQINIDALYELVVNKKITYTEISKFPVVKRDLALIVDDAVSFSALEQVCKKELREVLLDVSLFDVFKDAAFEGKKQYAIRFSMQDKQKTMEDADIEKYINKVLETLKKEVGATLR